MLLVGRSASHSELFLTRDQQLTFQRQSTVIAAEPFITDETRWRSKYVAFYPLSDVLTQLPVHVLTLGFGHQVDGHAARIDVFSVFKVMWERLG